MGHDHSDAPAGGPLWAGGFVGAPDPRMWAFTTSLAVDRRLWRQDVAGSRAHVRALVRAGVLGEEEGQRLLDGLAKVAAELAGDSFEWAAGDEDVHTAVAGLVDALVAAAKAHPDAVLPGLTHLQPAQPVTWGFQLAAHGFALTRDLGRLQDAARRADVSPLGAGAVAGSSFPLDPAATAADLGFAAAFDNAMDATAARDAVAELLAAAAIAMVDASRLAEDVTLWAGRGWVRLPDAWATGSSMLPQKRNPDVAELARGRAGTVIGRLAGLLATLKGLPLAYARDLQEDKAAAFDAVDTLVATMAAMAGLVGGLEPDSARMRAAAEEGEATAVDLAEALVRKGVPFRQAHAAVAAAVRAAAERGTRLAGLPADQLAAIHPQLAAAAGEVLSVDGSLAAKVTPGSTEPSRVAEQLTVLEVTTATARAWAVEFRT